MNASGHTSRGYAGSIRRPIGRPGASWAVVDRWKRLWTVPELVENANRAFPTSSLDGAENAPPTTAYRPSRGYEWAHDVR